MEKDGPCVPTKGERKEEDRSFPPIIPYAEYVLARLDFPENIGKRAFKGIQSEDLPHIDDKTLLPLVSK